MRDVEGVGEGEKKHKQTDTDMQSPHASCLYTRRGHKNAVSPPAAKKAPDTLPRLVVWQLVLWSRKNKEQTRTKKWDKAEVDKESKRKTQGKKEKEKQRNMVLLLNTSHKAKTIPHYELEIEFKYQGGANVIALTSSPYQYGLRP